MSAAALPASAPSAPRSNPTSNPTSTSTSIALALAGPAVVGACLAVASGLASAPLGAGYLTAIVMGLGALMLPALYIGTAFVGAAPPARDVLRAALDAMRALGLLMLGLAPALAFLVATSTSFAATFVLGHVVVALAAVLGLRAFYVRLFEGRSRLKAVPVFLLWSFIALAIGWRLFYVAFSSL